MASTLPAVAGSPFGSLTAETVDTAGFLENTVRGVKITAAALKFALKIYARYKVIIDRALDLLTASGNTDSAALKVALNDAFNHASALDKLNFPGAG